MGSSRHTPELSNRSEEELKDCPVGDVRDLPLRQCARIEVAPSDYLRHPDWFSRSRERLSQLVRTELLKECQSGSRIHYRQEAGSQNKCVLLVTIWAAMHGPPSRSGDAAQDGKK